MGGIVCTSAWGSRRLKGSAATRCRSNANHEVFSGKVIARWQSSACWQSRQTANHKKLISPSPSRERGFSCHKSGNATFVRSALRHCEADKSASRPFLRVRKRFCKQNRTKIAALVADFDLQSADGKFVRPLSSFFDSQRPSPSRERGFLLPYFCYHMFILHAFLL